jgi:hypothetical protein
MHTHAPFVIETRTMLLAAAALLAGPPALADARAGAPEGRFVRHLTHCAHLLGGEDFEEPVSAEYSRDLAAVLGRGGRVPAVVFARLRDACASELARRSSTTLRTVGTHGFR